LKLKSLLKQGELEPCVS